ncbi:MAG TPA: DUF2071 domain-containing protein [Solirubrobacteraceae bacterium]
MPRRPWVMAQTWRFLLFAHWPVEAAKLREVMPQALPPQTFEGSAWLGVTPFAVQDLRLRMTLPVPRLSSFPEINVRTYVTVAGKPGIYFFSLDAANALAVGAARLLYRLPYFPARMDLDRAGQCIRYRSERVVGAAPTTADFHASYRASGPAFRAGEGTLEHWLTERYCLYTLDGAGRVQRTQIHHPPWPLQPAEAQLDRNTMGRELGVELDGQPLLHYAERQDVVFWAREPAR